MSFMYFLRDLESIYTNFPWKFFLDKKCKSSEKTMLINDAYFLYFLKKHYFFYPFQFSMLVDTLHSHANIEVTLEIKNVSTCQ